MWKTATIAFLIAAAASSVLTELVRSFVHKRRKRVDGLGGSQDIAMWGTFLGWLCVAGAVICGVGWFLSS